MTAGPYDKRRPPGGREVLRRTKTDAPMSAESSADWSVLRPLIEKLMDKRREDSDVRRQPMANALVNIVERLDQEKQERDHARAEAKEKREHKIKMVKVWAAAIVTVLGGVGGLVGYFVSTAPPKPPKVEAQDVAARVDETSQQVEKKVSAANERIEKLEDIAVDQQLQLEETDVRQSDGFEWVGKKIDAAHPRQATRVPEPPTLKAAKRGKKAAATRERLLGNQGSP